MYAPHARILASGHVIAGLTPTTAQQVTEALNTRPAPAAPPLRARARLEGIEASR
ncbi:hypothetical protein [Streptomyces sp. NBC_00273]|uniref:hypothetical protein n=1 Tax=Streptomyces sp. NBC_00273 TaxID=2903644 RepID=UPI002E29EF9D|nr:hypothetical protein [Streptomyces sp. NBC_00273]